MALEDNPAAFYWVWGADNIAYGPVELPTLVGWVKEERVIAKSWVYSETPGTWTKAADLPELRLFFDRARRGAGGAGLAPAAVSAAELKPGTLRRIKVLAGMDERQLASFMKYMEVVHVRQFANVVTKGQEGDSMFLVLEGELRAFSVVDGKETTLSTMGVGEFFGEVSLLDRGRRSANVAANKDSVLLEVSCAGMETMLAEAPALAAPFLYELGRTVVGRVRNLTKKYEDSIHWSRAAGAAS
jgi:hypothetical protein